MTLRRRTRRRREEPEPRLQRQQQIAAPLQPLSHNRLFHADADRLPRRRGASPGGRGRVIRRCDIIKLLNRSVGRSQICHFRRISGAQPLQLFHIPPSFPSFRGYSLLLLLPAPRFPPQQPLLRPRPLTAPHLRTSQAAELQLALLALQN